MLGYIVTYIEENHLENDYNKFCKDKYGDRQLTNAEIILSLQQFYNMNCEDVPF